MRKWTCLLLSGILMTFSSLGEYMPGENVQAVLRAFLGLDSTPVYEEIEVDLSENPMTLEIDGTLEVKETIVSTPVITYPAVLIYHTHTDEAYKKGDQDYVETGTGRTMDPDYSVISVGKTLSDALQDYGFPVIHDTTDHVSSGFNQAYQASLKTVEKYIGQTEIFIDLHRDAYYGQSPHTVTQDGKEYARMCFVVARGTQYKDPPHTKENEQLAQKLTDQINTLCPGLARPLIYKDTRFNQHVGDACLLIEMGDEENTLEQVKNTALIVAEAFSIVYE